MNNKLFETYLKEKPQDHSPLEDWVSFLKWWAGRLYFIFMLDSTLTSTLLRVPYWFTAAWTQLAPSLPTQCPGAAETQKSASTLPGTPAEVSWAGSGPQRLRAHLAPGPCLGVHTHASQGAWCWSWVLGPSWFWRTKEPWLSVFIWPSGLEHALLSLEPSSKAHEKTNLYSSFSFQLVFSTGTSSLSTWYVVIAFCSTHL